MTTDLEAEARRVMREAVHDPQMGHVALTKEVRSSSRFITAITLIIVVAGVVLIGVVTVAGYRG